MQMGVIKGPGLRLGTAALGMMCLAGCAPLGLSFEGDRRLRGGDIDGAMSAYGESLDARSSPRTLKKLEDARALKAQALTEEGISAGGRGDHENAFRLLSRALALNPHDLIALDALDDARDALLQEAQRADITLQFERSLELYELILSQYRRETAAQEGAQKARRALAQAALTHAKQVSKTSTGAAFLAYLRALTFEPENPEAIAGAEAMAHSLHDDFQEALDAHSKVHPLGGEDGKTHAGCQEAIGALLQEANDLEAAGWVNPALDRRLLIFLWTHDPLPLAASVEEMELSIEQVKGWLLQTPTASHPGYGR